MKNWLELSYVEDDEIAGFSMLGEEFFHNPELYNTNAAVGICNIIEEPYLLYNRQGFIEWIESLRDKDGYYHETPERRGKGIPLVNTQMAIDTLAALGHSFQEEEQTIEYVLSLQQPSGLFIYSHDPSMKLGKTKDQKVSATFSAVKILSALGFKNQDIYNTIALALNDYLLTELISKIEPEQYGGDKHGYIVLAIETLALLNPSEISIEYMDFIRQNLQNVSSFPGDIITASLIVNILDTAKALSMPEIESGFYNNDLKE